MRLWIWVNLFQPHCIQALFRLCATVMLDLETQIRDIERSLSALHAERAQITERLDAYKCRYDRGTVLYWKG